MSQGTCCLFSSFSKRLKKGSDLTLMERLTHAENITYGITEADHAAIQQLIEACNRHDGIDFPFAVNELPSSTDELVATLLYSVNQVPLGLLCIYQWTGVPEIYGLVHPAQRRSGSGLALLEEARELLQRRGRHFLQLGCHGSLPSGLAFAEANGATFEYAEYHMQLDMQALPQPTRAHAELTLRQAETTEAEQLAMIAAQAFDEPVAEMRDWLTSDILKTDHRAYFIELQGTPIGTIRTVEVADQQADITLFCLLQPYRGRGYGRQILLSTVDLLRSEQYLHIALDVKTNNSNALALYQSCGFQETRKDSYYQFTL